MPTWCPWDFWCVPWQICWSRWALNGSIFPFSDWGFLRAKGSNIVSVITISGWGCCFVFPCAFAVHEGQGLSLQQHDWSNAQLQHFEAHAFDCRQSRAAQLPKNIQQAGPLLDWQCVSSSFSSTDHCPRLCTYVHMYYYMNNLQR